jgi:putative ABC transport system substrate-binding protein
MTMGRRDFITLTGGAAAAWPLAARAQQGAVPVVGFLNSNTSEAGTFLSTAVAAKMVEVLHEAAPTVGVVALLVNPTNPTTEGELKDLQEAARILGLQLNILNARDAREIDAAFETLVQARIGAMLIQGDSFFNTRIKQLVALTVRHAIAVIYPGREFVDAGGLLSYGASIPDAFRITGAYTGRILKGERPGDLPVQQSTKIELIVNLTTAKAIGLALPLTLLGRADEVIE